MFTDYQYSRYQRVNPSGVLSASVTASVVAVPAKAKMAVFIQRIAVAITTAASANLQFIDSITSQSIFTAVGTPSIGAQEVDFGPEGLELTTGAGLVVLGTASGIAGSWHVEGYRRPAAGQALTLEEFKEA